MAGKPSVVPWDDEDEDAAIALEALLTAEAVATAKAEVRAHKLVEGAQARRGTAHWTKRATSTRRWNGC